MDTDVALEPAIAARFIEAIEADPAAPLLHLLGEDGGAEAYSRGQLLARAGRWRAFYHERGCGPGDRVIVILPHSADLYAAYLGAILGGQVPAMFNFPSPKLSEQAYFGPVGQLLGRADARLLVTYPSLRDGLAPVLAEAGVPTELACPDALPDETDCPDPTPSPEPDADAPALVQYSSGTTGLKKAVEISHRMLLWQVDAYAKAIDLTDDDVIVSWLPLYHDMGLIACFFLPLLTGTPLVAISPFDWVRRPAMLLEAIGRYAGTLCWLPNFAYNHLVRSASDALPDDLDLSSLRGVVNCSEPILAGTHRQFLERFAPAGLRPDALWTCYAMAENTFAVTHGGGRGAVAVDHIDARRWAADGVAAPAGAEAGPRRDMVGSGRPLPGTQVRIADADGADLPDRTAGEIVLWSPSLAAGYANDPAASAEAFREGWYATGDLGYLADGELFVTGRKKDLIIIAGVNIYPQDIEAIVNAVPGVIPGRCVALGAADADAGTEQLVVLAETREADPSRRERIGRAIAEAVASATEVVAGDVRLLGHMALAKSSSGKIARTENLRRYRQGAAEEQQVAAPGPAGAGAKEAPGGGTVTDRVRRVVTGVLAAGAGRAGPPADGERLISSGRIDSLNVVNLILALEAAFALTIGPETQGRLDAFDSIERIARLMTELTDGGEHRPATASTAAPPAAPPAVPRPADLDPPRPIPPGMSVRDRKCADFAAGAGDRDLLILGSSRVMALGAAAAAERGYRAYNFSVNSARAEDWYCIVRFVLAHNRRPLRRVLVGIDIESFSSQMNVDFRLLGSEPLREYLDPADQLDDRDRDEALASLSTAERQRFLAIQQQLRNQDLDGVRPFGIRPASGELAYLGNDPVSTAFNARRPVRLADPTSANQEYKLRMHRFGLLNPKRLAYFTRMVAPCIDNGLPVTCFLTPCHAELLRFLQRETTYNDRLAEFRAGVKVTSSPMFQLLDCSAPPAFAGSEDDFIDPAHVGAHNADKLMRHLLDQAEAAAR